MAMAICDGAARNSALSTRKRLISSHKASPPATDRKPARYLGRSTLPSPGAATDSAGRDSGGLTVLTPALVTLMAIRYALIGNLRHARQYETIDREAGGQIAKVAQCVDHVADFALGHLTGQLEQLLVAQKGVRF